MKIDPKYFVWLWNAVHCASKLTRDGKHEECNEAHTEWMQEIQRLVDDAYNKGFKRGKQSNENPSS